jgi:hypothetical protein
MKARFGSLVLACSLSLPASAGHAVKVRGKLKSYSDKDVTIITAEGKKQKIPFSRLVLGKDADLSKMLDKESDFYYSADPAMEPTAPQP